MLVPLKPTAFFALSRVALCRTASPWQRIPFGTEYIGEVTLFFKEGEEDEEANQCYKRCQKCNALGRIQLMKTVNT